MIKVLIIDDSALVRTVLRTILEAAPGIEVVGTASNPYYARNKILKYQPDVITLDVEMPEMDGLTFLKKLMNYKPTPVVMISAYTREGAQTTLRALALGAVDYIAKPQKDIQQSLADLSSEIIEKVRTAARAKVMRHDSTFSLRAPGKVAVDQVLRRTAAKFNLSTQKVICIGGSTGATAAVELIIKALPRGFPGIVVVLHMPAQFTGAFAERLNSLCEVEVLESRNGMEIISGRAIIAAGGVHSLIQKAGSGYYVEAKDGPPVNRHKPSVDVTFRSAANSAGKHAIAVLLTGMGDDGAQGMKDLYERGATTIAQDEKTCVVFGMPRAAIELGCVRSVLPLEHIPQSLLRSIMGVGSHEPATG